MLTCHKRDFAAPALEARRRAVAGRALLQQRLLLLILSLGVPPGAAHMLVSASRCLRARTRSRAVARRFGGPLCLCLVLSLRSAVKHISNSVVWCETGYT